MKCLILLGLLLCVAHVALSADEGDWVDPNRLPVDVGANAFYAGYLNLSTNDDRALFYVYTPSQHNPSKDPLVVLTSHGPGCSMMQSFLYSKG